MTGEFKSLKRRIFDAINDKDDGGKPDHIFDFFIIGVIILNVVMIFLETYPAIYAKYHGTFLLFEYFTIAIFTGEYFLRVWTCTYYPDFADPFFGRIRYIFSITLIIDFFAVFPFYLSLLLPLDHHIVQFLRLFRLFRVLKLLRYYGSIDVIFQVIKKNSQYLFSIIVILLIFLSFSSYLFYMFESAVQPDNVKDFDDAFWWAIETTSTVGYGDVFPVTEIGKLFTVIIMLIGIGLIALPTGILASGFLEEMKLRSDPMATSNQPSIADEIRKLNQLLEEGLLTEDEFRIGKEKLLR